MSKQRPIVVYKDKSSDTWYWSCRIPFCELNNWGAGHAGALQDGRAHLDRHHRFGFSR
jgi:hypothetical protein